MSAATTAITESVVTVPLLAAFAAIVALLDRVRQPDTSAAFMPVPRVRRSRADDRRTERDARPDPETVARDAEIVEAWQRGEIPGRHAPGGVR